MPLITSVQGVLAVLVGVAAFWFFVEKITGWKLFQFMPPLIFIYLTPVVLSNTGVLTGESPVYGVLRHIGLPAFIVLLLLGIDVGAAVRVMGKGVLVMLLGTAGVVLGAPVAYLVVKGMLAPEAWIGFGALAGSWIGGTGNMAATFAAIAPAQGEPGREMADAMFGLAVLADNAVYIVWLPLLLASKSFAERFNKWARVPADRLEKMEAAAAEMAASKVDRAPTMVDYLNLGVITAVVIAIGSWLAPLIPPITLGGEAVVTASTYNILIVTTLGIALSFTPARRIPGSHEIAMAIVYVFVARMGAVASLAGLAQAPAFILGAFLWIFIHGLFVLGGAWLFRVDVHSAAIASAANIGGAASAPVVASAHRESLVPVSILMALIGYAVGNYAAFLAATLCRLV
ncbi:MAG: DUF819 family protein, partial [Acidobacteriota bacterium]